MWSASQPICRLTIMPLLWQKPHTMGWLSKYSKVFPCALPSTCIWYCGVWPASSKIYLKRFLFLSPPSGLHILVSQFSHWRLLSPERNLPFSATSWITIKTNVVGFIDTYFENSRFHPDQFWARCFFLFLMATPSQPGWYTLGGSLAQNKA